MDNQSVILIFCIGLLIGAGAITGAVWINSWDDEIDIEGIGRFVRVDAEPVDVDKIGCLTSLDLNRDDLRAVVILSNPCTQFGLPSRLYLQQDEEGNQFGIPVCWLEVDS